MSANNIGREQDRRWLIAPKRIHSSDFEETRKRHLPSAPEKAATVATAATRDRRNVAAVADVAASGDGAITRDNGVEN